MAWSDVAWPSEGRRERIRAPSWAAASCTSLGLLESSIMDETSSEIGPLHDSRSSASVSERRSSELPEFKSAIISAIVSCECESPLAFEQPWPRPCRVQRSHLTQV